MCTAVTFRSGETYFGRTLDHDESYLEEVTITPRLFPFCFRHMGQLQRQYAIIGMAHVEDGCPLYYDGMNEKGLAMAGLNFPGNACYHMPERKRSNVAHFELIPWVLFQCETVSQARRLLNQTTITNTPFHDRLPPASLHWIISDKDASIVVESTRNGLKIYDNPTGVLANNPPFDEQLFNLNNYLSLSAKEPENFFSDKLPLAPYSRGMGAIGLPGDLSSQSRFVRASFTNLNARTGSTRREDLSQFFHIMETVSQTKGCCDLGNGRYETTLYTSCCDLENGAYFYTTYSNRQISGVNLKKEDLNRDCLIRFPIGAQEQIRWIN